jgi:hypothetical protein
LPPSPLADIFSDINGLIPITQPIITDGFGHYDFYVAAGLYTLVVALGGVVQQVYPDQSVGLGNAGPGNPYTAGANITIVGSVISAVIPPVTGIELQTNSVDNASQTKLNILNGTGITATSNGTGGVTIASSVLGATSCDHFYGGVGDTNCPPVGTGGRVGANGNANLTVACYLFKLNSTITVGRCVIDVTQRAGQNGLIAFGIYDASKNLLAQFQYTVPSGSTTGAVAIPVTGSAVALTPGNYYFAHAADSVANGGPFLVANIALDGSQNIALNGSGTGEPRVATAANAMAAGSLPATLGALSALDLSTLRSIPMAAFFA